MISSVPENPPDGTLAGTPAVGPRGSGREAAAPPQAAAAEGRDARGTQHVPDGPAQAPSTETQYVPDGTLIAGSKATVPAAPRAKGSIQPRDPSETRHVADLPKFGRFQALAELGSGAMGTVFRARDEVLGRAVAIKALSAKDAGVRERFIQISRALAAAHAANIVHRDVKPANILAAGDVWKLADFGIARLPDSTLTVEGQFLGSPSYAAPESLRSAQFSPASDIYGLGATLYEALTGSPPHGDHDMQSIVRKLEQDAPPVHARRAVPGPLNDALMATLARDPAKRPTAEQLANLLAATASSDESRPVPRSGPSTRTKIIALALAAIAIVLVVFAIKRDKSSSANRRLDPREQFSKPPARDEARRGEGGDEETPLEPSQPQPQIVDQYGNPVDDETAAKILEDMKRDAEAEVERFHGGKRKKRGRR